MSDLARVKKIKGNKLGYLKYLILLTAILTVKPAWAELYQGGSAENFASFHYNPENCYAVQEGEKTFHKGLFYPDGDLMERGLARLRPIEEVQAASIRTYEAPERLNYRVYFAEGKFQSPLHDFIFPPENGVPIEAQLTPQLIAGTIRQMEHILNKGYAQWVNYLDLSHAHPHLPVGVEPGELAKSIGYGEYHSRVFASQELVFLYHLAEKIELVKVPNAASEHIRFRFLSRNLVGNPYHTDDFKVFVTDKNKNNTYRIPDESGLRGRNGTLYFHGNKNGCFQLQTANGVVNFDMSMAIPDPDPEVEAMSGE